MKVGFSSMACPGWDLVTITDKAAEYGFDGIELRGLSGELHLPLVPELARKPDWTKGVLREKNLDLICLGTSATLDSKKRSVIAKQKSVITEYIELASRLGCPFVRIFAGEVQRWDNQNKALSRISQALASLIPVASRWGVTLLIENGGDFSDSASLWYIADAASHPNVGCCWNQCAALSYREHATNSIPRLGRKIGLVHMTDARFDENGVLLEYTQLGEGDAEVGLQIDLLRGMAYDGYLVFEWPRLWVDSLAPADSVLPGASAFLKAQIANEQKVLTAYKGDKNPARFAPRPRNDEPVAPIAG